MKGRRTVHEEYTRESSVTEFGIDIHDPNAKLDALGELLSEIFGDLEDSGTITREQARDYEGRVAAIVLGRPDLASVQGQLVA